MSEASEEVISMMKDLREQRSEEIIRLLKWKLKMRDEGYVGPFPDELMLKKIRKDANGKDARIQNQNEGRYRKTGIRFSGKRKVGNRQKVRRSRQNSKRRK